MKKKTKKRPLPRRAVLRWGDWTESFLNTDEIELIVVRGSAVPMIETFRKMAHARYPNLPERKAEVRWAAQVGWRVMRDTMSNLRRRAEMEKKAAMWDKEQEAREAAAQAAYEKSLTEESASDTGKSTAPSS